MSAPKQILELIALAGFYHTVSFFANGLRLPLEAFAVAFPTVGRDQDKEC